MVTSLASPPCYFDQPPGSISEKKASTWIEQTFGKDCVSGIKDYKSLINYVGIKDTVDCMLASSQRYQVLNLLLSGEFDGETIKSIFADVELYPRLQTKTKRIIDIAMNLALHSNIGIDDLIISLASRNKLRSRLKRALVTLYSSLSISKQSMNIDEEIEELINLIHQSNFGRKDEKWFDIEYWGVKSSMNARGCCHSCDSEWEVEICEFLYNREVEHQKPQSAYNSQYYEGTTMYPDWIIDGIMIELFGADFYKGYTEKIERKCQMALYPLIKISKDEFLAGTWKQKLADELEI